MNQVDSSQAQKSQKIKNEAAQKTFNVNEVIFENGNYILSKILFG